MGIEVDGCDGEELVEVNCKAKGAETREGGKSVYVGMGGGE